MVSLQYEKVTQALNYLLRSSSTGLSKLQLVKLLWAADRYHLRKYGRLLTEDSYVAMPNGPVPSLALNILNENSDFLPEGSSSYSKKYLRKSSGHNVISLSEVDKDLLSKSDMEALHFAYSILGSHPKLSEFTHRYPEWKKYEDVLDTIKTSIPIDVVDFFENPSDGQDDPFRMPKDVLENSLDKLKRTQRTKNILYL